MKILFSKKTFILLLSLFFMTPVYAITQDTYPFTAKSDAERFLSLSKEIRCVVCQNQNIADSNAPLAHDLRTKVYQMVLANKSDQEIKDYLVKRYGEFILLKPPVNRLTIILWLFPLILLSLVVFCLRKTIHRPSKIC